LSSSIDHKYSQKLHYNSLFAFKLPLISLSFTRLEDLVAQDDIVASIASLIDSGNLPHLLLYGPPGTGKTSTIVAAAKRMYGSTKAYNSMTLELNASDARGIDVSTIERL
jgi:replication-associated recombination protein RarA